MPKRKSVAPTAAAAPSTSSKAADWPIARRLYSWHPAGKRRRKVTVEIGAPEPGGWSWQCRVRITGLLAAFDGFGYGEDAVQALELALRWVGKHLAESPQFIAGELEQFGKAMTDGTDLRLPLPLAALQSSLAMFRMAIRGLGVRGRAGEEWRKHMLAVTKELSVDLAKLAAAAPSEAPRKRLPRRTNQ